MLAVHVDIGRGIGAIDFQIGAAGLGQIGFPDFPRVAAGSTEIVVSSVLTVLRVPRVGQIDGLSVCRKGGGNLRRPLEKGPAIVDIRNCSHIVASFGKGAPGLECPMLRYSPRLAFSAASFSATFFLLSG